MSRAAEALLAYVLRIAPEAEVHCWPASGAANADAAPREGIDDTPPEKILAAKNLRPPPPRAIAVDLASEVVLLNGQKVQLTGVEFMLVRYLAQNCSRPVRREELQKLLETLDFPGCAPRSIDVYVGRLRRKLGGARHVIVTVRGGGYQFLQGPYSAIRGPAEYAL
ncbi:winged helix-turn-helix domain-containing protein [Arthrobacter sp. UNC362MFTsu5.1]|uniref:winged helix-turn-helix domain-containing protein n=1 Tax=Arthrobacter sp. UNC362MFTsu5.1 TaxID=1449044 RepID=UPI0022AF2808|nr:winged helix-turn-helix domain-containing protein [Arthrobacter sp. UNC362MFTsu5.1]